jgi:protein phosphatase
MREQFDIIGDVHSCWDELSRLLHKLGYELDGSGAILKLREDRRIVFLGDIMDRGPHPLPCFALAKAVVENGFGFWVLGNHCDKLRRWALGRPVRQSHGLAKTVAEFERVGIDKRQVAGFLGSLPHYLILDGGCLVCVHGAWRDGLETEKPSFVRSWCLYAPTTGKTLPGGFPDRIDWVTQRRVRDNSPWIVYGHQPYREARFENRTVGIDTSCVFGGELTALRWPEMELVSVDAEHQYDMRPTEEASDGV